MRNNKQKDKVIKKMKNSILKWEKKHYKFKNYRGAKRIDGIRENKCPDGGGAALFFGCSYPSHYPATTKSLSDTYKILGIGTIYDCCGVPLEHIGLKDEKNAVIQSIDKRLQKANITRLIVVCPNCYYNLHGNIKAEVVTIYESLGNIQKEGFIKFYPPNFAPEALINKANPYQEEKEPEPMHYQIYLPCNDRVSKRFIQDMKWYIGDDITFVTGVSCCGLGPSAKKQAPGYTKRQGGKLNTYIEETNNSDIYVYCAACSATFTRTSQANVQHLLNVILDSAEMPKLKYSFLNRIRFKFTK